MSRRKDGIGQQAQAERFERDRFVYCLKLQNHTDMIKKINKEAPAEAWAVACGVPKETSNSEEVVTFDQLKDKVGHYKKVMTEDFKVPSKTLLTMVPINIGHLREFISQNGKDLAGARLYLIKGSNEMAKDDFEVLFVPCREKPDPENAGYTFYEDMLPPAQGEQTYILSMTCRRPPGCGKGAAYQ
jgi:hypothetical protein